jgi:hypothetical protein
MSSAITASEALLLALSLLLPTAALGESQILLPMPSVLREVAATTFDRDGNAIGLSSFVMEQLESGLRHMKIEMAADDGGRNRSEAILAPVEGDTTPALRLLEQRSQARRADGSSLDLLVIDHVKGRASCYPADDADLSRGRHVDLPGNDRVVNVPMQLLFRPLAAGEVDSVHFQVTLCRKGPVIHDMIAVRGPRKRVEGRGVIEIRYGPDFGKVAAFIASRVLPSFSFWFDTQTGEYLGHRMPLHTKGPEVLLVRQGLTPPDIGLD